MNLKKNIAYQLLYQIIILVIPLVLSKYVTHIINKDTLGVYSYSYSIASYFVLFAMLGIQKYGTRAISQVKDDKIQLRKVFWGLYLVHAIVSVLCLICYFLFCAFYPVEDSSVYYIQGLYVMSALFDITWLFYGLENFKSVVTKNFIIKILEIISIFSFVKTNNDLNAYTFIKACSIFLGQIVLFPNVIRNIQPIRISISDIKPHIRPLLILSISVFSTSIYSMLNTVLLGALSPGGSGDVALYEYADKIIKIPLSAIASIEMVMLPRLSYINATGDEKRLKDIIGKSIVIVGLISMGAAFGIASISRTFVELWYGGDYQYCASLIIYLAPVVFVISFGDIIRSQFLIPKSKDKEYMISIIFGALVNLIINIATIPKLGLIGAIIGTISAEFIICFSQLFATKNELPIKRYVFEMIPFGIFGFIIFAVNQKIGMVLGMNYKSLVVQMLMGAGIYIAFSVIYLVLFKRDILNTVLKK